MKVVAAYLLAVLGGTASPSAEDVKGILSSGTLLCFCQLFYCDLIVVLFVHFQFLIFYCIFKSILSVVCCFVLIDCS